MRTYLVATNIKLEYADDPVGVDTLKRWGLTELTGDQYLSLREFDTLSQEDRIAVIVAGIKVLQPVGADDTQRAMMVVGAGNNLLSLRPESMQVLNLLHHERFGRLSGPEFWELVSVVRHGDSDGAKALLVHMGYDKKEAEYGVKMIALKVTTASESVKGSKHTDPASKTAQIELQPVRGYKVSGPVERAQLYDFVWGMSPHNNIHLILRGGLKTECGQTVTNKWDRRAEVRPGNVCQKCVNLYNVSRAIPYRLDPVGAWLNPDMERPDED